MLKVGLTGGVACGKSTVGEMFAARGVKLIKADEVAHRLMRPGQPVYENVVRQFGRDVLNQNETINREKLAQIAFGEGRFEELNRIVHPAVIAEQDRWMKEEGLRDRNSIVMVEAALILEAGVGNRFNKLVMVTCRPEQKVSRFAQRQALPEEAARAEVERRQKAQIPDEDKTRRADYVIDNSGSQADTDRQVGVVYRELKALAVKNW